MAKDSDNCAQDCPFIVESLLPTLSLPDQFILAMRGKGAAPLNRAQSSPLLAHRFLHLSHEGRSLPGAIPGSHQHSPMPAGTRLGSAQGLQCSPPPAAGAHCLLLSCPVQQPQGLGYRTVSNFVPVPRHQGRGT